MTPSKPNTTSSELREALKDTKTFNYNVYFGVGGGDNAISFEDALDEIEALIASKVEEARENAFSGGFGAGGGEVHNLELAWKLYNEALQSKEENNGK